MKVISDSSPLIGLSSIRKLGILKTLFGEIIIPGAVFEEVVVLGKNKVGSKEVKTASREWIRVKEVKNIQGVNSLKTILDSGEAEVITLAQEINADLLLINNREPREFAKTLDFKVLGTVGVIKLAWRKGIVKQPLNFVYQLKIRGFWMSDALIEKIEKGISQ